MLNLKSKLSVLSVLGVIFWTMSAVARPAEVLIIRHAEKPADKNAIDLNEKGFARATALAQIFERQPNLAQFGLPVQFFAAAYIPGSTSRRTIQTLTPLAQKLQVNIDSTFAKDKYLPMVQKILNDPAYNNKVVMIAWVHSAIVELAQAFGSAPANFWSDTSFDRIWVIRFNPDGTVVSKDIPQALLPGDSQ